MVDKTYNKLIGRYISGLGPEAQAIIKEMYDYRYAPRPEGVKPPKGYPIDLEKKIIDILIIALQNRRNFLSYEETNQELEGQREVPQSAQNRNMPTIPQELKDIAEELGCNTINFVTTTSEGDIYSLAEKDPSGEYLPTGLPMLYAVKGSSVSELPDFRVHEILSCIEERSMKRECNIQRELSYAYNSAKARIAAHPDYAERKKKILEKYDFLRSEEEALEKAKTAIKNGSFCQVWVNIEKDEEFYYFADKWIVSDDYDILLAAEYLGFAQVYPGFFSDRFRVDQGTGSDPLDNCHKK